MEGSRRLSTVALVAAALFVAVAFPAHTVADGSATGALKGVVYDTTCYGPCVYPSSPPPRYTGDNLVVRIRSLPDRELVAELHPKDGRFRIELAPGPYRVRARVRGGDCWQGEAKGVKVVEGQTAQVRLHVYNGCVV